ncbi:hypothetical protein L2E82_19190 [Cichorium intybus]|uniref:Uncharacterized protein n=1 Tax=Cichorium intybus TaxID=13427 RepID=A0ACB9FCX1_CICIN|nr:hypothetical protein L2E82_19190 [Cichorium intybus]
MLKNNLSSYSSPFDSEDENNNSSVADSLDYLESERSTEMMCTPASAVSFFDESSCRDSVSEGTHVSARKISDAGDSTPGSGDLSNANGSLVSSKQGFGESLNDALPVSFPFRQASSMAV